MFNYICEECGQGTVREKIFHDYLTKIKGYPFVVDKAIIGVCDKCGAKHFDANETKRWEQSYPSNIESKRIRFFIFLKIWILNNKIRQFFNNNYGNQKLNQWEEAVKNEVDGDLIYLTSIVNRLLKDRNGLSFEEITKLNILSLKYLIDEKIIKKLEQISFDFKFVGKTTISDEYWIFLGNLFWKIRKNTFMDSKFYERCQFFIFSNSWYDIYLPPLSLDEAFIYIAELVSKKICSGGDTNKFFATSGHLHWIC